MSYQQHEIKAPDLKQPTRDVSGVGSKSGRIIAVFKNIEYGKLAEVFANLRPTLPNLVDIPKGVNEFEAQLKKLLLLEYYPMAFDEKGLNTMFSFDHVARLLDNNPLFRQRICDVLNDLISHLWDSNPGDLCNIIKESKKNSSGNEPPFSVVIEIKRHLTRKEHVLLDQTLEKIYNSQQGKEEDIDEELLKEILLPIMTNAIGTLLAAAVIAILEKRRGKKTFIWTRSRAKIERIVCSRPPLKSKNLESVLTLNETADLLKCSNDDVRFLIRNRKIRVKGGQGKPYQIKYGDLVKLQRKYYR